jgi:hypothetical protein
MAIDYFGHSTRETGDAQRLILRARTEHPEWFDQILLLYDAKPMKGPFDREIAREFGIEGKSHFMLSVNDKDRFWDCLDDALDYLYRLFGADTLVITHGLDTIRPPPAD